MAGSHSKPIFSFLWNLHTVLCSGGTSLHSSAGTSGLHQQSCVVKAETVWPTSLKYLLFGLFQKKFAAPVPGPLPLALSTLSCGCPYGSTLDRRLQRAGIAEFPVGAALLCCPERLCHCDGQNERDSPGVADLETMFSDEGERFVLDHVYNGSLLVYVIIGLKEVGAL